VKASQKQVRAEMRVGQGDMKAAVNWIFVQIWWHHQQMSGGRPGLAFIDQWTQSLCRELSSKIWGTERDL
jgi:hypothetical protein